MYNFTIDDALISKLAQDYGIEKKYIESLFRIYRGFSGNIKQQYLAHIIRAMETTLRDVSHNPLFQIVCSPVDAASKELGIVRATYYKNEYFAIFYHPKTDEKQLRELLAHELGHLFLVEWFNSTTDSQYNEKLFIEPLSTIFGIFTMFDKNRWYHNEAARYRQSPEDILKDFSLLNNRSGHKFNISD